MSWYSNATGKLPIVECLALLRCELLAILFFVLSFVQTLDLLLCELNVQFLLAMLHV